MCWYPFRKVVLQGQPKGATKGKSSRFLKMSTNQLGNSKLQTHHPCFPVHGVDRPSWIGFRAGGWIGSGRSEGLRVPCGWMACSPSSMKLLDWILGQRLLHRIRMAFRGARGSKICLPKSSEGLQLAIPLGLPINFCPSSSWVQTHRPTLNRPARAWPRGRSSPETGS